MCLQLDVRADTVTMVRCCGELSLIGYFWVCYDIRSASNSVFRPRMLVPQLSAYLRIQGLWKMVQVRYIRRWWSSWWHACQCGCLLHTGVWRVFVCWLLSLGSLDGAVGTVTGYRAGRRKNRFAPKKKVLLIPSGRALGSKQLRFDWYWGPYLRGYIGRAVRLTTDLYIVAGLRTGGSMHPFPLYAVMTCTGDLYIVCLGSVGISRRLSSVSEGSWLTRKGIYSESSTLWKGTCKPKHIARCMDQSHELSSEFTLSWKCTNVLCTPYDRRVCWGGGGQGRIKTGYVTDFEDVPLKKQNAQRMHTQPRSQLDSLV